MAAACVARPCFDGIESASCRRKIPRLRTQLAEGRQWEDPVQMWTAGTYIVGGGTRYSMHTANPQNHLTTARPTPASRSEYTQRDLYLKASALVAELIRDVSIPQLIHYSPPPLCEYDQPAASPHDTNSLAYATIETASTAPKTTVVRRRAVRDSSSADTMDSKVNFGDTSGFQTRGKKKKKGAAFDPWGDEEEKKDDTNNAGDGAEGGGGGSNGNDGAGAGGSGGGGDDHNDGNGDDDDWAFGGSKKTKKTAKKKKQEEEEEAKKKEEESTANADPLSWADETNNANADEDWTLGFSSAKKDKKKKKKGDDPPPAVPDAPPAASGFQDINLDDAGPKLDFTFDALDDGKKTTGSSFGTWGKTWDFDSVGKIDKKDDKDKHADNGALGDNNPWSLGSKTKKKSAFASFDFGDFGSNGTTDLTFGSDDVTSGKATDDAWGISASAKKDKDKKKKGGIEEIKEEPEEDNSWGGWGMKTAKKKPVKSAVDETVTEKKVDTVVDEPETFDWTFGKKDKKKKDLLTETDDKHKDTKAQDDKLAGDDDDWMAGAWGNTASKKKTSKKSTGLDDLSASLDLTSNVDSKKSAKDTPADDPWGAFTDVKKDKKKTKKGVVEEEPPPPPPAPDPVPTEDIWSTFSVGKKSKKSKATEPEPEPEIVVVPETETAEPLVAWDFGLTPVKKRKKEREMRMDGTWDTRVTQDMVDEAEAARSGGIVVLEAEPEEEIQPAEEKVAWDAGLTDKEKRVKKKEMIKDGTWETRVTQEMLDEEAAAAAVAAESEKQPEPEPEPEPVVEKKVPWDFGLSTVKKKKKEKEMKLDGTWESRITQEMIDEEEAAAAAAKSKPEPEPEPEVVKEERFPWDHGLTPLQKRKKEKAMKLDGTWDDRLTQEKIDEEEKAAAAAKAELEAVKEERFPWDHGLTPIQKRRKEREMKADGTWDDRLTQEKIDDEAAAAAAKTEQADVAKEDTWGTFSSWGTKDKEKDKKKKSGVTFDSVVEEKADDGWGGGWGSSTKDKKTKKTEAEPEAKPAKSHDPPDDIWDFGLGSKDKNKKDKAKEVKKKGLTSPIEEVSPEPVVADAHVEDDLWGQFSKSTKKGKKSTKVDEPPPPAPTPPAQGLTPEPKPTDMPDVDDFGWAGLDSGKKSKKASEEPAKKSSIWGSFATSTSTSKLKKEKEAKAKKEAEEQAQKEEDDRRRREAEEAEAAKLAEEEAAKKKSKSGRLSKTTSKTEEKKKSGDDLLDLLDEPVATPASSKLKKSTTKSSDKTEDEKASDYFGFWGSNSTSKKTAGKKETDNKKEIGKQGAANGGDPLDELAKDLESPVGDKLTTSSSKLSKTMSNGKIKVGSTVAERIKALEGKKDSSGSKAKVEEPLTKEEPALVAALSPKEEKKASKTKAATKSKKDAPLSPGASDEKKSKDSVPGSFPGGFNDEEDLLAADDLNKAFSPDKSKSKKSSKVEAKPLKSGKTTKAEASSKDKSMDSASKTIDLLDDPKLPTPPPEEKKSDKKEKPRVEKTSSSWGFWGAAPPPKKASKSAEDDSSADNKVESKKEKPSSGLTRSKSTRTPKEKEREDRKEAEKASKSSGSEKDSSSKTKERPKASKGMSFSSFMLGTAPPSAMRSKPTRRSSVAESKSSSRRQSMDQSGLISPPPDKDDGVMNDKAAKVMGLKSSKVSRKSSVKDKSKAYVDPYPIDDDDMVMINPTGKQSADQKKSKEKTKSKPTTTRTGKPRSKTLSGDEDVVMVDTGGDAIMSGPDDAETQERGGNRKSGFFGFGGFFGGGAKAAPVEKVQEPPVTEVEDGGLPIRTKSSRRRSKVPDAGDGFTTDAPAETDADVEARRAERRAKRDAREKAEEDERMAREQRRKERRDREKADLEARREKARETARKEREAEDQRREEKRAKRREKEDRLAKEEAEIEAAAEKRREERRRLREKLEAEAGEKIISKEERRRTYAEEENHRTPREDRKSRTKDSSSKRKSTALMEEYHESRSGSGRGVKPPTNKTSSWIDSQKDEPPEIPPVEPTVLDESGQVPRPVDEIDSGSRRRRKEKDKYAGMTEEEIADYRARKKAQRRATEKSASGGSDERDARKSSRRSRVVDDDYYAGDNVKTFDGRPTLGRSESKRNSFLGKFF